MCGIAGFFDSRLNSVQQEAIVGAMLERIAHRGRDHRSFIVRDEVVLGHNRLSVIDVSEQAHQPFVFRNYVLIFNGEVYNYLEIRQELETLGHQFTTSGDTEVVIHAYAQWGSAAVERFMGMWALVILDTLDGSLFCSRDRFGIKPFYYIVQGDRFYFASEIKALSESPIFNDSLNTGHIDRFVYLGLVAFKDETFHSTVRSLDAACNLYWKKGDFRIERYWQLQTVNSRLSYQDAVIEFRRLLLQSVKQHLRSDVKVGACLSGGIDSSGLVSAISRYHPFDFEAYHVYYDGAGEADERPFVREVLSRYSNIEPHYYTPAEDDIREAFTMMPEIQDGPVPGSGVLSQYFLFKAASADRVKVMIDGQGADEYLAGYHNFYPYFFAYLLSQLKLRSYFSEVSAYLNPKDSGAGERLSLHLRAFKNIFLSYENSKRSELRRLRSMSLMRDDNNTHFSMLPSEGLGHFDDVFMQHINLMVLPGLLHFEDRNSMAFTIESRVPYLDHRLVEFAFSLPFEYKIRDGLTKVILRDSLSEFTPSSILQRRDKKGFTTPGEVKWMRTSLRHLLEPQNLKPLEPLFRMEKVTEMMRRFLAGDNSQALFLWRLVSLNEWLKMRSFKTKV